MPKIVGRTRGSRGEFEGERRQFVTVTDLRREIVRLYWAGKMAYQSPPEREAISGRTGTPARAQAAPVHRAAAQLFKSGE